MHKSFQLLLTCLLLAFMPLVMAADKKKNAEIPPPSLDGHSYAIIYPTEDKKPKDKITIANGKITVDTLKGMEFVYAAKVKASGKGIVSETEFSASTKTPEGIIYEISGSVMVGGEIRGSITRREIDMDPTARNFSGKESVGKK